VAELLVGHELSGVRDLALADFLGGAAVLFGMGDGTFGLPTSFQAGVRPGSVAMGDTNGDGKSDIVVVGSSGTVSILAGEGDGAFDPPVTYENGSGPSGATATKLLVLGAFDGRPGKDIAVVQYGQGSVAVLGQLPPN
jgi:hypothetical protein